MCSFFLNSGYDVTIYETRQEIGNPIRSPGIIKTIPKNSSNRLLQNKILLDGHLGESGLRNFLQKK